MSECGNSVRWDDMPIIRAICAFGWDADGRLPVKLVAQDGTECHFDVRRSDDLNHICVLFQRERSRMGENLPELRFELGSESAILTPPPK